MPGRYTIELRSVDAAENKLRRYVVIFAYQPGAENPYVVETQWGRFGSDLQTQRAAFATEDEALDRAREVLRTRQAHGYEWIRMDDGHPLREWAESIGFPKGEPPADQPTLFDSDEKESPPPAQLTLFG